MPLLASLTFGLERFVAHLQEGGRRYAVEHVLWLLLGLAFTERTLILFVLCWLTALLWFTRGAGPERLQMLWHRRRRLLVAHAVILGLYLAAYIPLALNFNAASMARRPFFAIVRHMVGTAFSAGFVGGPLDWRTSEVTQQAAHPSPAFLPLSQLIVLALVIASARTRRRALRACLLPVAVLLLNVVLVAVSRATYFGPEIALDYRFQTEAAVAAAWRSAAPSCQFAGHSSRASPARRASDSTRPVGPFRPWPSSSSSRP